MESKNKVFAAARGSLVDIVFAAARGSLVDIVFKYSPDGYFVGHSFGGKDVAMFETREDAQRALRQVARDSVIFAAPHNVYILDNDNDAYRQEVVAEPLPKGRRALSPEEIANERKFAAGIGRTVDFKAQEAEHAAAKLPEMEQSLISEFAERCKMGFAEYGPVFLGKRNWGKELKEEALDGLFYALMAAKTMEKYGDFIKALEEASDDDLSMDACSPDPLKQAAYLVKKYASELEASEKLVSFLKTELERRRHEYDSLKCEISDRDMLVRELRKDLAALANELGMTRQVRNNYKESYEKLRKENLDMRAAMEAALSLGSPRA